MINFESIDNVSLIDNGLFHIECEITRSQPSMFRAARESHLVLYRSMVQALRGSSNLSITGRPSKDRLHQYRFDNEPWKEIRKVNINGCLLAWRFSIPVNCDEPQIDYSRIPELKNDDYLISFYDTLAMIQSECFMHKYVFSKEVRVTDNEMKQLEWLHENIRNEFEHFVPKGYLTHTRDLIGVAILSLRLSKELLFESKNVIPFSEQSQMSTKFDELMGKLVAL